MRQKEPSPLAETSELGALRSRIVALHVARNELIAKLAHDIRGPLTSIVGFAELLEEGMDGEAAIDAARTIRTNAGRLTQLTTDLLALNRAEPSELAIESKAVDIVQLLAEMADIGDLAPIMVLGDRERLTQAFEQILANAKKFSTNAGGISVHVKSDVDRVRITIADRGIGIPPEELESIGERFYRATNAKIAKLAGTGVGVFIATSIARAHGGDLSIRSVLGEGTTVEIALPPASGSHKKSVTLALEDDAKAYLARELRERGYRVVESGGDVTIDHLPSDYSLADVLELLN